MVFDFIRLFTILGHFRLYGFAGGGGGGENESILTINSIDVENIIAYEIEKPIESALKIFPSVVNYIQLCLIRNHVIRTFANSSKIFRSLEIPPTKISIIRIYVIETICIESIFMMKENLLDALP